MVVWGCTCRGGYNPIFIPLLRSFPVRSFDERLLLYKVVAAYSLEFGQFLLLPVPVDSRKQWGLRWWRGVRGGVVVAVMERYGEEEC